MNAHHLSNRRCCIKKILGNFIPQPNVNYGITIGFNNLDFLPDVMSYETSLPVEKVSYIFQPEVTREFDAWELRGVEGVDAVRRITRSSSGIVGEAFCSPLYSFDPCTSLGRRIYSPTVIRLE